MSEVIRALLQDYMMVAEEVCTQAKFMDRLLHRSGRSKFLRAELGSFPVIEGSHTVIVAEPDAYTIGCVDSHGNKTVLVSAVYLNGTSRVTGGEYEDMVRQRI
jgi:hypothetical protein